MASGNSLDLRTKLINFFNLFPFEKLLLRPLLYQLLNEFVASFIEILVDNEKESLAYIRVLTITLINNFGNPNLKSYLIIQPEELLLFKILCFKSKLIYQ